MRISIQETNERWQRGDCTLVDVRSISEFASGHVPGAINIPMEQVESRLDDLGAAPLLILCKGGQRATLVADRLHHVRSDVGVVDGGTQAWIKAGLPIVRCVPSCWSLERQVRLGAGLIVATGIALSVLLNPAWICLSGFVGAGLTFAGLTDICPMGVLLSKMPWNVPSKPEIVRQVTDVKSSSMP